MASVHFNVNTQGALIMVEKLNQIGKSAMPLAIRGTLNGAAFDVKQRTLDESATQNFIRRTPTFFKRFSGVTRASGLNVNSMQAAVGMTAQGVSRAEIAIAHMEQQEYGGAINDGLDYLSGSRSGDPLRKVSRSKYYNKENIVKGKFKNKGGTVKSRRVAAAFVALREDKQLRIKMGNRKFYSQVKGIFKYKKGGRVKIRSKLLSASRDGHPSKINATHFSEEAAERTQPRIPEIFNREATRQINRVWK